MGAACWHWQLWTVPIPISHTGEDREHFPTHQLQKFGSVWPSSFHINRPRFIGGKLKREWDGVERWGGAGGAQSGVRTRESLSFPLCCNSPLQPRERAALASPVSVAPPPPGVGGHWGSTPLNSHVGNLRFSGSGNGLSTTTFPPPIEKCYPYKAVFDETVDWLMKFTVHWTE